MASLALSLELVEPPPPAPGWCAVAVTATGAGLPAGHRVTLNYGSTCELDGATVGDFTQVLSVETDGTFSFRSVGSYELLDVELAFEGAIYGNAKGVIGRGGTLAEAGPVTIALL